MPKYTEDEKREWKENMRKAAKAISEMSEGQRDALAAEYPVVTCEGHPISPRNSILIQSQVGFTVTMIGGFKQWREAGRQVPKGRKATGYILAPQKRKDSEEVSFRFVAMWDINHTEPIEGIEEPKPALAIAEESESLKPVSRLEQMAASIG